MLWNVIHRLVADTKIPISDNAYYTQTCNFSVHSRQSQKSEEKFP